MSRFFALATLVVAMVALADLVANPAGTKQLGNSAVSIEKSALNAELGKTS
jgi:uncharacterized protein YqgC (DUF456 family)